MLELTQSLDTGERAELLLAEQTIAAGIRSFNEVGAALVKIRDLRLYRETHQTFEAYCSEMWDLGRSQAYRLIDASEVVANLSPIGDAAPMPTNEAQVRPLAKLEPEQQQEAWARAVETAPDGRVTAAHVAQVVEEMTGPAQAEESDFPEVETNYTPEPAAVSVPVEVIEQPKQPSSNAQKALHSSASNEWYTPARYMEAVRKVMGGIDLDPASNAIANATVQALYYYTQADNGLSKTWLGMSYFRPTKAKKMELCECLCHRRDAATHAISKSRLTLSIFTATHRGLAGSPISALRVAAQKAVTRASGKTNQQLAPIAEGLAPSFTGTGAGHACEHGISSATISQPMIPLPSSPAQSAASASLQPLSTSGQTEQSAPDWTPGAETVCGHGLDQTWPNGEPIQSNGSASSLKSAGTPNPQRGENPSVYSPTSTTTSAAPGASEPLGVGLPPTGSDANEIGGIAAPTVAGEASNSPKTTLSRSATQGAPEQYLTTWFPHALPATAASSIDHLLSGSRTRADWSASWVISSGCENCSECVLNLHPGKLFTNPPYGRDEGESNQARWSARLLERYRAGDVTEAILLVNATTDRSWFQPLWDYPICFTNHRIPFYTEDGEGTQPTHGNAFIYLGPHVDRFVEAFSSFGVIATRMA